MAKILSKRLRVVFRLRVEDLARLMMVCARTVHYWDRDKQPTKLHERLMEVCVQEGTADPDLWKWVHAQLETSSPIAILTTILIRARLHETPASPQAPGGGAAGPQAELLAKLGL